MLTPSAVRVLGIDPGTRVLGYGVVDVDGPSWRYVECGVVRAPAGDVPRRLAAIGEALADVLREHRPAALAIEKAFYGKSVGSALVLGQARGAVMLLAGQHGVPVFEYAPALVKRCVVGHGRATKQDVQGRVRLLLSLRRTPAEDAADALAIALCHAQHARPSLRAALVSTRSVLS